MAVTVIMEHDTRRFPDGQARRSDRPRRTERGVGQLLEKLQRFEEEMPFGS
jgi:hypothetical protein